MKLKNTKNYFSIRTKMLAVTIMAGIMLLGISVFIMRNSLSKLETDLIGDMLRGDIQHIRHIIGKGEWNIKEDTLCLGDAVIGDGTAEKAFLLPFLQCERETGTFSYTFIKCSDEGLTWVGDDKTGYQQGHFFRVAGSTRGPNGESILATYMDKKVADVLDAKGIYLGPANVNGRQIFCVYETLEAADGEVVGAIVVGRGVEEMELQIRNTSRRYILLYLIVIFLAIFVILIVLTPWVGATRKIENYLKIVGGGNFPEEPIIIKSHDELGAVADSINEMVNSLKEKELLTSFRHNIQKNAILSLSANITQNRIEEGAEHFLALKDENGVVTYDALINSALEYVIAPEHLDMVRSRLNPDSLETRFAIDPEIEITYKASVKKLLEIVKMEPEVELELMASGKEWIWQTNRSVLVKNPKGELIIYMDVLDVDQKMVDAEKIRLMATTDPLTGLLNRRAFEESLNNFLSEEDVSGTLFMFDLDHFKEVNDNLGHPQGDELLKDTASTIKNIFRGEDVICRLGGDEFCAFAKGFTDINLLKKRAEELLEKGHRTFDAGNGKTIKVSFSIGISIYPKDSGDMESLYNCADRALYDAKEAGRDCYRFYKA